MKKEHKNITQVAIEINFKTAHGREACYRWDVACLMRIKQYALISY
jgi:hypothetical protein